MVSRLFEKPRVHSVGTVIGTLRMASEAKVLVWKLPRPVQGGQAESGARVGACQSRWTLTRIGVPGARFKLLSYYSCSTLSRLTIMFRLGVGPVGVCPWAIFQLGVLFFVSGCQCQVEISESLC
jgi:hypothetical protein